MDIIIKYIAVGVGAYAFANLLLYAIKQSAEAWKQWREKRKEERLKWKYAKVNTDNVILNAITKNRLICFKGSPGTGKSMLMNICARFIFDKRTEFDRKNKRYNQVMNPKYLAQEKQLEENKKLPVYSNMEMLDKESNRTSGELLPYLEMRRKAVSRCVFCIDENSSLFGKELYKKQQEEDDPVVKEMAELFKKIRHYIDGWILMTEQGGENIYIRFREAGFACVEALDTSVKISFWGKILKFTLQTLNLVLPGWATANKYRVYNSILFDEDNKKMHKKLILPTYFSNPVEYYTRKKEINDYIKWKYTRFTTRFRYNNQEYFIKYSNKEKFIYNTRAYEGEYNSKFNSKGERILPYDKK